MKPPLPQVRVLIKGFVQKVSAEFPGENGSVFRVAEIYNGENPLSLFCFHWSLFEHMDGLAEKVAVFYCLPPSKGEYSINSFKVDGTHYKPQSQQGKDLFGA